MAAIIYSTDGIELMMTSSGTLLLFVSMFSKCSGSPSLRIFFSPFKNRFCNFEVVFSDVKICCCLHVWFILSRASDLALFLRCFICMYVSCLLLDEYSRILGLTLKLEFDCFSNYLFFGSKPLALLLTKCCKRSIQPNIR